VSRKPTRAGKAKSAKPRAVKRPPEIPAAKWRAYSPSYQKRMAGFYKLHPGAPQYRARGKQAGESLTRKARLEARVEALAARQAYRGERQGAADADTLADKYRALIRAEGEGAFGRMERLIFARQPGQGRITSQELGFNWEDYDGNESELFYN
jgi:hypothetical protein